MNLNGAIKLLVYCHAAAFGFLECLTLLWLKFGRESEVCSKAICGLMRTDPLAAPLGVPIEGFGLAFYLATISLVPFAILTGSSRAWRGAVWLSSLGAVIGVALFHYVLSKYGTTCPWCNASTVCSLLMAACLISFERLPRWSARPLLGLGAVACAFASGTLYLAAQSFLAPRVNMTVLRSLAEDELFREQRWIRQTADRLGKLTVFVDLDCGSCRRAIRKLMHGPIDRGVSLRFARPDSTYEREAALAYLDADSDDQRRTALEILLDDDSRTLDTVKRARKAIGRGFATPGANRQLALDTDVSVRLASETLPLLILQMGRERSVTSIRELAK